MYGALRMVRSNLLPQFNALKAVRQALHSPCLPGSLRIGKHIFLCEGAAHNFPLI